MKTTTGSKFDQWQVSQLAAVLNSHKAGAGNAPAAMEDIFKELHSTFAQGNSANPFFKNTPKVFSRTTVFFVQLAKAWKAAGMKAQSVDNLLMFFYGQVATMSPAISCMPDVDMSEAKTILKTIKFQP